MDIIRLTNKGKYTIKHVIKRGNMYYFDATGAQPGLAKL